MQLVPHKDDFRNATRISSHRLHVLDPDQPERMGRNSRVYSIPRIDHGSVHYKANFSRMHPRVH